MLKYLSHILRVLCFLPYLSRAAWAYTRGRHAVFRETPLWVLNSIANHDAVGDEKIDDFILEARRELTFRRNERASQTRNQP